MTNALLVNLQMLIDDAKCFEVLRQLHGLKRSLACVASPIKSLSADSMKQPLRQRYQYKACL